MILCEIDQRRDNWAEDSRPSAERVGRPAPDDEGRELPADAGEGSVTRRSDTPRRTIGSQCCVSGAMKVLQHTVYVGPIRGCELPAQRADLLRDL